ncbi:MAG: hypothetical protein IPK07_19630 [Deltaproteobacteria bacterium]|nr:hypothetical protein [Deltaproteobacteria bacterium]
MSTRRLRTFLRALLWLDCGAALVCFLLPFRYGILALTYPLAFGLSWRLSRPDQRRGRSVLAALTAGFAVVVTGSGLMSWLAPQLDDARVGFITLHAMTGAHWMLLVIPPLARHIRRGLTLPGRAQWSGQAALAVARLSFWPAIVGGTIAIGPLWLRTWHVWFLVPALVALALHALVPRIRRAGLAGWRPAAIGAGVGSALFVFACWANSRPAPEPPARATYAANPPLDARPAATTTEGGHTVPEELVGGSERCADGACHPRVTDQWRRSAHHRSANVFYRKAVEIAVERHGWTSVRLCASCHDPVALLTGYYANRPAALFRAERGSRGVSCLACHRAQITLDHVGSGSYRFDPLASTSARRWRATASTPCVPRTSRTCWPKIATPSPRCAANATRSRCTDRMGSRCSSRTLTANGARGRSATRESNRAGPCGRASRATCRRSSTRIARGRARRATASWARARTSPRSRPMPSASTISPGS